MSIDWPKLWRLFMASESLQALTIGLLAAVLATGCMEPSLPPRLPHSTGPFTTPGFVIVPLLPSVRR